MTTSKTDRKIPPDRLDPGYQLRHNRRLSAQERVAARLERLHWASHGDKPGYFYKSACRIIIGEGETLLSAFEDESSTRIVWECSFGVKTPYQVVMAAAMAAEGGG